MLAKCMPGLEHLKSLAFIVWNWFLNQLRRAARRYLSREVPSGVFIQGASCIFFSRGMSIQLFI